MGRAIYDPVNRLGVYKRLSDVPDRYRLGVFQSAYEGRDVWAEYLDEKMLPKGLSERHEQDVRRFGQRWKDHLAEHCDGRHHALADPEHVETWSAALLDQYSLRTAQEHWTTIEGFYAWLLTHTAHEHHLYNPFWMAAAVEGSAAREVFDHRRERNAARRSDADKNEEGDK